MTDAVTAPGACVGSGARAPLCACVLKRHVGRKTLPSVASSSVPTESCAVGSQSELRNVGHCRHDNMHKRKSHIL